MCVILTIYQKRKNSQIQKDILELYDNVKKSNPDGVGVIAFNKKEDNIHYYRDMDKSSESFGEILKKYQTIMIHFRLATSGSRNVDNVHFWQNKNWYFAHNGIVSGLVDKEQLESDSLLFFEHLIKNNFLLDNGNIKIKAISKASNNFNLWGRFILLNDKQKKATYFGDWYVYKINQTLIIASTKLELGTTDSILGFIFEKPVVYQENKIESCVFSIDFVIGESKIIKKEFNFHSQSFGLTKNGYKHSLKYPYSFTPQPKEKYFNDGEEYFPI